MRRKLNPRHSPATLVAVIALVAALGGTAIAAGALTGPQKKQVKKIAVKVFKGKIAGASVAHAISADTAAKATTATTATKANTATTATKATNADQLGGRPASDYQRRVQGSCPAPQGIGSIGQAGEVTCATAVTAISMTPSEGVVASQNLGSGLQLVTVCHDGGQVEMAFQDIGSNAATLNWFYGNGTATAVPASGTTLAAGSGEQDFPFLSARIEGQFIYSSGATVMTINLHAFDGGSFCEVRGTVESASS